ncbi:urease accessory protein UreD [Metabacillus malikii]|uniref:Urease accessory protein UreD n=1 Tax=Metabacillus malikii TaxID=1504265 RepID=A0ABT9ZMM8_9BACI|nr:urease accessory protein UreD [Metabacillus malikii]MDQ0233062.1 urease accessory protein [Metabacillus malikii]
MTYTGYLHVKVGKRRDKSVITNSYFDGVLKITRPTYLHDDLPLLTLIHVGGGYVDGDTYKTEVVVEKSARLALTTQASTKVYKSPRDGVNQVMDYVLEPNSELFVKQDSLILYQDAQFTQQTNVYMSSLATFFYTDIMTPGWSEDGSLFTYTKCTSKMKIYVDGSLQVFDHLLIEPNEQLQSIMHLEGYSHIGTMFLIHPKVTESLIEKLRTKLAHFTSESRFGISLVANNGLTLRILAYSTPLIEKVFSECESLMMKELNNEEKLEWRKG